MVVSLLSLVVVWLVGGPRCMLFNFASDALIFFLKSISSLALFSSFTYVIFFMFLLILLMWNYLLLLCIVICNPLIMYLLIFPSSIFWSICLQRIVTSVIYLSVGSSFPCVRVKRSSSSFSFSGLNFPIISFFTSSKLLISFGLIQFM